mmetsp:Transcript_64027/g.118961  ORF Transcript_64027/g.118961 Transcript_64027/m.118961 type:complete len:141 (+) Transcript_64027:43-465(+)
MNVGGGSASSCTAPLAGGEDAVHGFQGTIAGKALKKSLEGLPDEVAARIWMAFDAAMHEELEKVPKVWKLEVKPSKLASFNIVTDSVADSLSAIVEEAPEVNLGGACIYMDRTGTNASIRIVASGTPGVITREGNLESSM